MCAKSFGRRCLGADSWISTLKSSALEAHEAEDVVGPCIESHSSGPGAGGVLAASLFNRTSPATMNKALLSGLSRVPQPHSCQLHRLPWLDQKRTFSTLRSELR